VEEEGRKREGRRRGRTGYGGRGALRINSIKNRMPERTFRRGQSHWGAQKVDTLRLLQPPRGGGKKGYDVG